MSTSELSLRQIPDQWWQTAEQVYPMIELVAASRTGPIWDRKLRLFAAETCRLYALAVPRLYSDKKGDRVLSMCDILGVLASLCDRVADEGANRRGWEKSHLFEMCLVEHENGGWPPGVKACLNVCMDPWNAKQWRAFDAMLPGPEHASILRDIIGHAPDTPLSWELTMNHLSLIGRQASPLAVQICRDNDWVALPVLADALEDIVGLADPIVCHLRSPGRHVRGCWALDLVRRAACLTRRG